MKYFSILSIKDAGTALQLVASTINPVYISEVLHPGEDEHLQR